MWKLLLLDALGLEHLAFLGLDLLVKLGASRWFVAVSASSVGRLCVVLGLFGFALFLLLLAGLCESVLDRLFVLGVERLVRVGLALLVVLAVVIVVHANIGVRARSVSLIAIGAVGAS